MPHKLTTEEFIKRSKEIHGDKYDYSQVNYIGNHIKVNIICKTHGIFSQIPKSHLKGCGCPVCALSKKGNKQSNTEEFIKKAKVIHGNKYDYSKVVYEKSNKKVCITCHIHGDFKQTANDHLRGAGCPLCGAKSTWDVRGRKTTEQFIDECKKVHGDKYDYTKVEYKASHKKVIITCKQHGNFEVTPVNHLHGNGCPKCKAEYLSSSQRMSQHDFVKKANEIHNCKYDYSLLDYKGGSKKIDIICPIHGVFTQDPFSHLSGHGCPTCSNERLSLRFRSNTEEFIEKAKSVHGDLYDYKNVKYKNSKEKVEIICKIHGAFFQTPNGHLGGAGCPECSNSRGETAVSVYLEHHNIKYIRQFIIRNENVFCKNKIIKVDFYLPEYDSFIEFNGEQHYRPNEHFGGKAIFEMQKERDFALKQYCKEHNILFIEIPYTKLDSIDTMLDKKLKGKRKNRIPNHNTTK